MVEAPLTKTQRKALQWFAVVVYASSFGPSDPSLAMVRKLVALGLVVEVGREPGVFGFTRYAITKAGREALL